MSTPLFSIVIPTFNRSDLVTFAIQSIRRQTFPDFEIVVSDNFSTDDTAQVVNQITDSRLRYVRTPAHLVMADNWEFGRSKARGRLILMLADDDALIATALTSFAAAFRRHNAEFLFCSVAEYRDRTFLGAGANILLFPPFSGSSRVIQRDDFLGSLFAFRPTLRFDPSAFVFDRTIANTVASRCGRFFKTNGVEYFSWPLAAVLANRIVHIDAPLAITGRTAKSWGTNLVLCNPGSERIAEYVADVDQVRHCAPLNNFTFCNLMAEGMLMAKRLFPEELTRYDFDEREYLRRTWRELRQRESLGVNVTAELDELEGYVARYPSLTVELFGGNQASVTGSMSPAANTPARGRGPQNTWTRMRYEVPSWIQVAGEKSGFQDILGSAELLGSLVAPDENRGRDPRSALIGAQALTRARGAIYGDLPAAKAYLRFVMKVWPQAVRTAEFWSVVLRLAVGRPGNKVGHALKRRYRGLAFTRSRE
jgi:glycosyltransferase involved in cell wall biosynthesis